jgi:hypothetical protein
LPASKANSCSEVAGPIAGGGGRPDVSHLQVGPTNHTVDTAGCKGRRVQGWGFPSTEVLPYPCQRIVLYKVAANVMECMNMPGILRLPSP